MSFGPPVNQTQFNATLTRVAQLWQDAVTASQKLSSDVNGLGGATWLEGPQPGYGTADATAIMALIGQYSQCAGLISGTGSLAQPFNFLGAFAVVIDPTQVTSG